MTQSRDNTGKEELVEKIAQTIVSFYFPKEYAAKPDAQLALHLISLISQAILSGESKELDKILGIVGRGFLERTINEDRIWWAADASALERYPEVDFIALSPTGTEEEK